MKKIFGNKKGYYITVIAISILCVLMIIKGSAGVSFVLYTMESETPEGMHLFAPSIDIIMILLDNLFIIIISLAFLILNIIYNEKRIWKLIVLIIFVIVFTILIPLKMEKSSVRTDINLITFNTGYHKIAEPLFNIFDFKY